MKKLTVILILLLAVSAFAQTARPDRMPRWDRLVDWLLNGQETFTYKTLTSPTITTGTLTNPTVTTGTFTNPTIITTNDLTAEAVKLGQGVLDSLGRVLMYVQNKNGSALAAGDVCVWDATAVSVCDTISVMQEDVTLDDDLSSESGFLCLEIDCHGTPDAGDSLEVWGTTYEGGASDYSKMLLPASADVDFVVVDTSTAAPILHWSLIDSIKFNSDAYTDGADSVDVYAYAVAGVIACDGANTDIAGVAIGAISDNAYGYIVTHGVCEATVDAGTNEATPGALLEGASGGDFVVDAAATTGKNAARALEYSSADNKKIKVMVDSY
jgi:hypothetical protein